MRFVWGTTPIFHVAHLPAEGPLTTKDVLLRTVCRWQYPPGSVSHSYKAPSKKRLCRGCLNALERGVRQAEYRVLLAAAGGDHERVTDERLEKLTEHARSHVVHAVRDILDCRKSTERERRDDDQ